MIPEFNIKVCVPVHVQKPARVKFRFLYLFFALPCLTVITSCNNSSSAHNNKSDSLAVLKLPEPSPVSPEEATRIKAACELWYDSALKQKGFNGGILVAKNGNTIFEQYNGTGHLPGTDTISANTPLHIASVTKTFTAMAVLKLAEENKLGIDDEFSKYFPQFNYPGVTIRCLLNHRSGLSNYTHSMDALGWDKHKYVTNNDVLEFLVNRKAELKDVAPPNIHFSYSNSNYALLALLIEKISGKKYSEYLEETFFGPLHMKDTYVFSLDDSLKALPSYDWKGRLIPLDFLDGVYGDKNIYTTVRNLLTWDRALCAGLFFKPETFEQAYAPYSNEKPGIKNYGLGWRMYIYPTGKKIIYHNGRWHGSNASFLRLLGDSATIITIGNKFTRSVYHAKILSSLFDNYFSTGDEEEAESQKELISDTLAHRHTNTDKAAMKSKKLNPAKSYKKQEKKN